MHKLFIAYILIGLQISASAQPDPRKYADLIKAADLKKHLTVIAGAGMEGRETAMEGQRKAAAYIEQYFRSLPLKPGNDTSYQQVFPLYEDSMLRSRLQIGSAAFKYGKDYMVSARVSQNQNVHATSIVFAGYGISDSAYDDYRGIDVKGAIVVMALGEPKQGDTYLLSGTNRMTAWSSIIKKKQAAMEKGAAGILVVSPRVVSIDSTVAFNIAKSGFYLNSLEAPAISSVNAANISQAVFKEIFKDAADSLLGKLGRSEPMLSKDYRTLSGEIIFEYAKATYKKGSSSNVMAYLEGTDKKDEYVFLTAHYDHVGKKGNIIFYGADDDGSGTVSVMEMAEAFAKAGEAGNRPRRSIVFMTVSGEEKGLWGSEYYSDHPVFPLDKTTVDLNTDMVGRIDPKRTYGDSVNYIYVVGDDKLSSELKTISESVNSKYAHLELDYKYNNPNDPERIYYRSDHYNFARKGVPVIFYFNGTHADYHQPTDTVDKINFNLMEKRVRLIFLTAWEMANRDDLLKRDIPLN